jgi:hypothetical protein
MKLEINESYEGELVEDPQRVRDKANWALQTALKAAGVPKCCGGIEKSLTSKKGQRIGEMQVIEDITQALSKMYEHRLDLMRQDLISRIEENDVS